MKYLGALLCKNGNAHPEVNQRLGMAQQELDALMKIWKHTNIRLDRKVELYYSCIVSKLLYGLQSIWLTKNLRKKVEGVHSSCLRKIAGIAHSYISHVSNKEIRCITACMPIQFTLLESQLLYFGKIARSLQHPGRSLYSWMGVTI